MKSQEELLEILSEQVVEMEDEDIVETIQEYIENGYAVDQAVEALIRGMKEVGDLFAEEEYYVTDVLIAADAMNNAMDLLKPLMMEKRLPLAVRRKS